MNIVKVSIESLDGKSKDLFDYNKSISFEENMNHIRAKFKMPLKTDVYGLKIMETNCGDFVNLYVTEENQDLIKNAYFLKVAYSASHEVKTTFLLLKGGDRNTCFNNILNLTGDEQFIKELVKQNKHKFLTDFFINDKNLSNDEASACLLTIIHLFQTDLYVEITVELLNKLVYCINQDPEIWVHTIKYSISLLHKILCSSKEQIKQFKTWILDNIKLKQLIQFVRVPDDDLKYLTILLINNFVRHSSKCQRVQSIKEMNFKQNKTDIFNHIIKKTDLDNNIIYELYVYQTYLLSLYKDALISKIQLDSTRKEEFKINQRHQIFSKRLDKILDFEENNSKIHRSFESLTEVMGPKDLAISSHSADLKENDSEQISYLTYDSLRYYQKFHNKNYSQTLIDENYFGPGLFATSENVVQILAKILYIGKEPSSREIKNTFQPVIFDPNVKMPFFYELFSRSIWILSKTKNEMKVFSDVEYKKVLNVLEKQIRIVLNHQPKNFKSFTQFLLNTDYEVVQNKWQEEYAEQYKSLIDKNISVQKIKKNYSEANKTLVNEQRMNYLIKGTLFSKVNKHKKIESCFIQLSRNRKQLLMHKYNERKKSELKIIHIESIKYIVVGKACPHINSYIRKDCIFSIIIQNSNDYKLNHLNLITEDALECSYWLDGLYILLEKENRSKLFYKELEQLVTMDLSLHLLELQNISVPKKPPPIPPLPLTMPDLSPLLPEKETQGSRHM